MKKTFKKNTTCGLMIIAFILVSVSIPFATNAVTTTYTPLAPLPCIPSPSSTYTDSNGKTVTTPALTCASAGGDLKPVTEVNVNTYIQYTFNLLIALAAVAAVFMIVWGGFLYMTSDAIQNKKDGLTKIQHAVEGLLLVLCSFLILRTINPAFVNIPVGLVTPLNLRAPKDASNDWSTHLTAMADNFNVNIQNTQNNIQASQIKINDYQQQMAAAQAAMSALNCSESVPPTSCAALQLQVQSLQDKINTETGNVTANVGILGVNQQAVGNINASSTPEQVTASISNITQIADATNAQLAQSGQYNEIQKVNDQAYYSKAVVAVTAITNSINAITGIGNAISVIGSAESGRYIITADNNGYVTNRVYVSDFKSQVEDELSAAVNAKNQIIDPALKADMTAKINTASKLLLTKFP